MHFELIVRAFCRAITQESRDARSPGASAGLNVRTTHRRRPYRRSCESNELLTVSRGAFEIDRARMRASAPGRCAGALDRRFDTGVSRADARRAGATKLSQTPRRVVEDYICVMDTRRARPIRQNHASKQIRLSAGRIATVSAERRRPSSRSRAQAPK